MKRKINIDDTQLIKTLISTMIAKTPVAYIILDKDYRVHFINDYFLEFRKLKKGDVLGVHCYDVSNRGIPCAQCAVRKTIKTGERCFITRKDTLPDGTIRYMDDYSIPLYKPDGTFDFILEMMINRTHEFTLRDNAKKLFLDMVRTLVNFLEQKDSYTSTHSNDVSAISTKLAGYIGLTDDNLFLVNLTGLLHDIGKLAIPDNIINKNGKLNDEEYTKIKHHPVASYEFLSKLKRFDFIKEGAKHHHERWDGRGYPDALFERSIPLIARIISIADTYDAMTSTRSYRNALSHEIAVAEIQKNAGTQFDPELANKFVKMTTEIYKNRDMLVDRTIVEKVEDEQISRVLNSLDDKEYTAIDNKSVDNLMSDGFFVQEIFRNTPAYYIIVDDAFNVLYVSESVSNDMNMTKEELLNMRCYEVNNKKMNCFAVENGCIKCPVVRAFQTGTDQTGKVTELFNGKPMHFDIFAVPMELTDENGENFKCAIEILVDRTEEVNIQKEIEEDIKNVLDILYKLVTEIDADNTANKMKIVDEYNTFSEYLSVVKKSLEKLEG